jgi:4-cresol dehydrogenase (hydroxylating)
MELVLPPRFTARQFDAALAAFASVVGKDWVLASDDDRDAYADAYGMMDVDDHRPSAAVAPASVQEVQAILRLANQHRTPLWPISRGKNLGYGYAAPRLSGSVVLDLSRMNRILEVDPKRAYCVIEPGVGFFDLYNYLDEHKIPLWMSIPGNAWGSVLGNALDRGLGYSPLGDNAAALCGLEVVLPDGEIVRTGMGAMSGSTGWRHYPYGFGPSWDQMFVQSNFGVVTQAGVWLLPEPPASLKAKVSLRRPEDLAWAVDELSQLRMRNVIEHNLTLGNHMHDACVMTQREQWYTGPGALPDSVAQKIIDHYKVGWWNFTINLYGVEEAIRGNAKAVSQALEPHLGQPLDWTPWRQGEPYDQSSRAKPSVNSLQVVNWRGGRGGHIGFSPVMPPDGALALDQFRRMKARHDEHGIDYYTSFTLGRRHINNINTLIFNREDADMTAKARALFTVLIADSKARGYGEYRTHLSYMDAVSDSYDWGGHALRRLNQKLKDAIDPAGILAPGKNGIWPAAYRGKAT